MKLLNELNKYQLSTVGLVPELTLKEIHGLESFLRGWSKYSPEFMAPKVQLSFSEQLAVGT
jgi:hypothetical protein